MHWLCIVVHVKLSSRQQGYSYCGSLNKYEIIRNKATIRAEKVLTRLIFHNLFSQNQRGFLSVFLQHRKPKRRSHACIVWKKSHYSRLLWVSWARLWAGSISGARSSAETRFKTPPFTTQRRLSQISETGSVVLETAPWKRSIFIEKGDSTQTRDRQRSFNQVDFSEVLCTRTSPYIVLT